MPTAQPHTNDIHWQAESSDIRFDHLLKQRYPSLSNKIIKELFIRGLALRNGHTAKAHQRIKFGDHLTLQGGVPSLTPTPRPDKPLDIIYADRDVIIVNKPHALPCHPLAPWEDDSVCHRILARYPELIEIGEERAPGLLHRLDNGTSGVLCFARHQDAYELLVDARDNLSWDKWYLAWCRGTIEVPMTLETPIAHHYKHKHLMVTVESNIKYRGKPRAARTLLHPLHWSIDAKPPGYENATPLMIHIDTGVRHQIRVHLASIGHPILGDPIYLMHEPDKPNENATSHEILHLHAWKLGLPSPPLPKAVSVQILPHFPMPPVTSWSD